MFEDDLFFRCEVADSGGDFMAGSGCFDSNATELTISLYVRGGVIESVLAAEFLRDFRVGPFEISE